MQLVFSPFSIYTILPISKQMLIETETETSTKSLVKDNEWNKDKWSYIRKMIFPAL